MIQVKAPNPIPDGAIGPKIFLAGSIEMGSAADWQNVVAQAFKQDEVTILNPRRESWDSSWVQSINNPQFAQQVNWELDGLDYADLILVYLDPMTKSPISLMEIGLHADRGRMIVACPPGFWRRGNVEIVCDRYGIKLVSSLQELIAAARLYIEGDPRFT